ncbi:PaaI family thioesterase [Stenotrophomonas rhizophila]|uniref:PaaI family thioesterase n=1 Tax=Stenotrophomonas rhizophila TaxID=216778 RepID=UPI0028A97B18|nr:PaaI family thioesterase [Stenotrophomonas rhizophila]
MKASSQHLPVLDFLKKQITGTLSAGQTTHLRYPTAISALLGFKLIAIGEAMATLEFEADSVKHGNQQGTVHGGILAELADAAVGTAHSTLIQPATSFTSIELSISFLRPVWQARLRAHAWATYCGRTISHYRCDIQREDGMTVATATSIVMTLTQDRTEGR